VEKISSFEETLYSKLKTSYTGLCDVIVDKKKLNEDIEAQMKTVIEEVVAEIN
jgi:F0F1-type ATP synthase alpha subunit